MAPCKVKVQNANMTEKNMNMKETFGLNVQMGLAKALDVSVDNLLK